MLASTATFVLLSFAAAAQAVINTPTGLSTCEPSLISWDPSVAPYYLTVIKGGDPNSPTLKNLGTFQEGTTSTTWNVDLPGGTSVTIALKDGTGAILYSSAVTIAASSDTSCVNTAVGAAESAAASGSSSVAGVAAVASSGIASASASLLAATSSVVAAASSVTSAAVVSASSKASSVGSSKMAASSSVAAVASSASASVTAAAGNSGALNTLGSYSPLALVAAAVVGCAALF